MSLKITNDTVITALKETAKTVDKFINSVIPETAGPEKRLYDAMRYSALGAGKRLRPYLVMRSAAIFGVDSECSLRVAAAIELMHAYALIHDDLPCMDDAELRRGKPALHIAYDEATAVLAGDALQCLSFEILAEADTHADPRIRADLVLRLAQASGQRGMVGGQMIDLMSETQAIDLPTISRMNRMKTGGLISFSCIAGAVLGRANPAHRLALRNYAYDLGLAFQIVDDILDHTGDRSKTGKDAKKDAKSDKTTFVDSMGLDGAQKQAKTLIEQAIDHLATFGARADSLRAVARFVLHRQS